MKKITLLASAIALAALTTTPAIASDDAAAIFKSKCKMCHAIDKKKMGPAFKDMNADPAVLKTTISNGRKAMPAFDKKLSAEQIDALVAFIQASK